MATTKKATAKKETAPEVDYKSMVDDLTTKLSKVQDELSKTKKCSTNK